MQVWVSIFRFLAYFRVAARLRSVLSWMCSYLGSGFDFPRCWCRDRFGCRVVPSSASEEAEALLHSVSSRHQPTGTSEELKTDVDRAHICALHGLNPPRLAN